MPRPRRTARRDALHLPVLGAVAALSLLAGSAHTAQVPAREDGAAVAFGDAERAALAELGLTASETPVQGYLPDAACARCHARIASDYRTLGMSRSFSAPRDTRWIEDFSAGEYHHEPSDRTYRMERRDDQLIFHRSQKNAQGEELFEMEIPVDWVLGSGSVARLYLYATPSGELFQLPLAWYTQEQSWGMAPGFDQPTHLGVNRLVRRECLFCHNAYPLVGENIGSHHQPQVMSEDLPHGIGCQRCHGPGAAHVAAVQRGLSPEEVAARIVNPAQLPPERARDVCAQCHFQPTPAISRVRRFGRTAYDFRPGQALSDFMTMLDVVEPGRETGERFEINHHGYRLEQSACFTQNLESGGQGLQCTQCHDPHRKPARPAMHSRVREVCLECHDTSPEGDTSGTAPTPLPQAHLEHRECSTCHMPRRRAEDVVHAVMTDHRIQAAAADPATLVAALSEKEEAIEDIVLMRPRVDPTTDDIYRAVASARAGSEAPLATLERHLEALDNPPPELLHDIARLQVTSRRKEVPALDRALELTPDDPTLLGLRAVHWDQAGDLARALADLRRAVEALPRDGTLRANLGRLEQEAGEIEASIRTLERAVELRPNLATAWFWLARSLAKAKLNDRALEAGRQALVVEPSYTVAYQFLVLLLRETGAEAEAQMYLQHGLTHAAEPEALRDFMRSVGIGAHP